MGVNELIKVGSNIKKIRINKGIKQKDLAKKVNIPVSTLSNYENNYREPDGQLILDIADALQVPFFQLLQIDENADFWIGSEDIKKLESMTERDSSLEYYQKLGFYFEHVEGSDEFIVYYNKFNKKYRYKINIDVYVEIEENIKDIVEYVILKYLYTHGKKVPENQHEKN